PWVNPPPQEKWVPSHSGGMDAKPSRAKRRISSRPSHGFLERFRRSTLCALVSFTMFVIACFAPDCFVLENKKPTARLLWRWVISAGITISYLGRQPPRASAHGCTTTSTHTQRG